MRFQLSRGQKIPAWLALCLLVLLGAVVFWPALTTPFFLDDFLQSAMVHGRFPGVRGPLTLYDFIGDDNRDALFARGFLPWWTDPRLTLRFLRPLSSLLLFLSHRWFGAWPFVMHVHSFAWWVAAVLSARALFRRYLAPRAAAFATVVFALSPCHGLPLGWLANSEALMALTLSTLGLTAMLRWREEGGWRLAAWSLLAFSLALAAGEYGLGCAGYVVAFTLSTPKGAPRRWRSVLLFALPTIGYLVARRTLGYGALASGFYQDPLQDTGLFLNHVPWRFVALMLMGWFTQQETAAWRLVGDPEWRSVAGLIVMVPILVLVLRHVGRQLRPEVRTTMWTFVGGSLLSFLPLLAVLPSLRLLGVAMLGIAPAVGLVLDMAWFGRETEARHGLDELTAIVAMLLGFGHLIHSPARAWINSRQIKKHAVDFGKRTAELAKRLEGKSSADIVVILGLDDVFFYGFGLEALGVRDTHWTVLSHTGHVLCLRRDPSTIELVVGPESGIYPAAWGDLYRSELHPLRQGETFVTDEYYATVGETGRFGPRKVRFQFPSDLDDPRWVWVSESRPLDFQDAKPPKVGFGVPFDP